MVFLIHFTRANYKVRDAAAARIREHGGNSEFVGIVSGNEEREVCDYIRSVSSVDYKEIVTIPEIDEVVDAGVDNRVLREFEDGLDEKSIWSILAVDKELAPEYMNGADLAFRGGHVLSGTEMMAVVSGYVIFFTRLIEEHGVDFVLFRLGLHKSYMLILEEVCKKHDVIYASPVETKVFNYFTFTRNKRATLQGVLDTYVESNADDAKCLEANKCYEDMLESLDSKDKSYYFDQGNRQIDELTRIRAGALKGLYIAYLKEIKRFIRVTLFRMGSGREKEIVRGGLNKLFQLLMYHYKRYKQLSYAIDESYTDLVDYDEKYLYFPLHLVPEYTLQVQANEWMNQLYIIEMLSKSVPFDWKVYVKEHPGQLKHKLRPSNFYTEIRKYSNVKFVSAVSDNMELIKNSRMVFTVTGTAGWEAIAFYSKPVIHLSESMYEITGLSRRIDSLVGLGRVIKDEMERQSRIDLEERRQKIVRLIRAILENGYWSERPLVALGEQDYVVDDAEVAAEGDVLAEAIIHHFSLG